MIEAELPSNQTVPPKGWKRPFVETPTSKPFEIPASKQEVVEFMEEDESIGEVYITFLGPDPIDYKTNLALSLLGDYLSASSTSPLQKEFVEIPAPLTTALGFYSRDRVNKNEITFYAADVPAKHLETICGDIKDKLAKIVKEEGIDMTKMDLAIRKDKRKLLNSMESNVTQVFADGIIGGK